MRLSSANPVFTIVLGVFAGLPALSIDLSAPTLTILPTALDTTGFVAGLTLSLFMVGFAVGQFFGGRLSDRFGRRIVLLSALTFYVFAGMCCVFATSGPILVASRLVQGVGAGACAVQAMAIVQDVFRGEAARRKQSYVTVVISIVPMLAPAVGAFMVQAFGWRSVHAVLAVAGVLLLLLVALTIEESRPLESRSSLRGYGFKAGLDMLAESWFLRIAVTNALSYGAIFAYIAGAPVVVMQRFGYSSSAYAILFATTALSLTAGAYSNAGLGRRVSGDQLVMPALALQSVATIILVLADHGSMVFRLALAIPGLMLCCFGRGVASPNLVHLGVSGHRENAGLAAAMIGLSQLLVGAAASVLVAALLPRFGLAAVAMPMAILASAAALFWRLTAHAAARTATARAATARPQPDRS